MKTELKPQDLRIHNLVIYEGKEVLISVISPFWCIAIGIEKKLNYNEVSPIPLTQDMLLRLGFEFSGAGYVIDNEHFTFQLLFYDCWNISYKEKIGFGGSECYVQGFPEVHELQNLYYALTGTELTLKP